MENNRASIIIRTIDDRFPLLLRAVESIQNNDYPDKEVIVVYQGKNEKYFERLKQLEEKFTKLKFKFVQNPTTKDVRAENANIGIKKSTGKYLGFLDDDDVFYKNHISLLVNCINNSDKVWAYSQTARGTEGKNGEIVLVDKFFFHDTFSMEKLWKDNYISMISFLINKDKIEDKNLLIFNENLTYQEDYLFLLNLSTKYEPYCLPEVTNLCSGFKKFNRSREKRIKKDKKLVREMKSQIKSENKFIFVLKELNLMFKNYIKLFKKLFLIIRQERF